MLVCAVGYSLAGIKVDYVNVDKMGLKNSDEWKNLVADLALYEPDYVLATNKIADVSDANTKQALNKILNCVQDNRKVIKDLKKIVAILVEN